MEGGSISESDLDKLANQLKAQQASSFDFVIATCGLQLLG